MNLKSMNTVKKQNNLNINCTEEDKIMSRKVRELEHLVLQ